MTLDFENIDLFFNLTEFAQEVQIGPVGNQTTIRAIFDNEFWQMEEGVAAVSTSQPKITCRSMDVQNKPTGTPVYVSGVQYRMADKRPDGTGITEVYLHRG
jgi:hypothetical protein